MNPPSNSSTAAGATVIDARLERPAFADISTASDLTALIWDVDDALRLRNLDDRIGFVGTFSTAVRRDKGAAQSNSVLGPSFQGVSLPLRLEGHEVVVLLALGFLRLSAGSTSSGSSEGVCVVGSIEALAGQLSNQLAQLQQFFAPQFRNKVAVMLKVCDLAGKQPDPERRTVIAHGDTYGCDFVTYPDDPLVCHSTVLFKVVTPKSVLPRDAMAQARLATTAQKRVVYGTCPVEESPSSCRDWLLSLSSPRASAVASVSLHTLTWTGW